MKYLRLIAPAAWLYLVWISSGAIADSAAPVIKVLLRTTVSGDPSREVVVASAEFPVGWNTGRHTHPGDEYATVLEGELEIRIDDQPPKRVKAGEAYHNERDVVHETVNVGLGPVRLLSTFVIDKGQPVMKPVARTDR